jgi:streptogramin lyase
MVPGRRTAVAIAGSVALVLSISMTSGAGAAKLAPAPSAPGQAPHASGQAPSAPGQAPHASGQAPRVAYGAPRTVLAGPAGPEGIAVDGAGNVFMTYAASGLVVEVPKAGPQVVLAFSNLAGSAFPGQPGTLDSIVVDAAGDVFVADTSHNQVLELPKGGSQIVVPFTGLNFPEGLAVDGAGDVFVTDTQNARVLELPKGGSQIVVPFTGLNLPPPALNAPEGLAVDAAGDVFLADAYNHRLLKLSKDGTQVVVPVNPMGIDPVLPTGVTVDAAGNLFVTVYRLGVVKIAVGGGQTLLPIPLLTYDPTGVAVDSAGDVFVTSPTSNVVEELPAGGTAIAFPPNVPATPQAIAADDAGDVFVSDYTRNAVIEVPHGGGPPVTLPFIGLSNPEAVAVDGKGDVFVADNGNSRVLELPKGGSPVTVPFHGLSNPIGLAVDGAGDLFVTTGTTVIELPVGGAQVTLPFTGVSLALGVAVDGDGNVFVADGGQTVDVPCLGAPCQVVELHRGGGQTVIPVGPSGSIAQEFIGVAVDHAGNLFIAAHGVSELLKGAPPSSLIPLPLTAYNLPGVAVDRNGDVFAVDPTMNTVQELPIDQALFANPVNGQLNVDTTQPFTWTTLPAAQAYYLIVGTTVYGKDLVDSGILAPTQSGFVVPVLPSGRLLYATLFTEENGQWTRLQVVGFTAAERMAAFTYPVNGQANVDTSRPFAWTPDSAGQAYILVVGTTKFGHDLVNTGPLPPTQTSVAVPALPGGILYATLLAKVGGGWIHYQVVSFTAASGGAHFTHPVNAQLNVDTTAPFTWSTVAPAQGYQLIVGTTVYGHDLVNSAILTPTTSSYAVPALPTGHVLYATIYTEINGGWVNYNLVGFIPAPRAALPPSGIRSH